MESKRLKSPITAQTPTTLDPIVLSSWRNSPLRAAQVGPYTLVIVNADPSVLLLSTVLTENAPTQSRSQTNSEGFQAVKIPPLEPEASSLRNSLMWNPQKD